MEPFVTLQAVAAPLPVANIDTDQIIPARFLKRPRDERYASYLFHDLRFDPSGRPSGDFVLDRPGWRGARILVAGANFGVGSSREAAVHVLLRFGIRCVIAPSFGDIFHGNSLKNGLLPVTLTEAQTQRLLEQLAESPGRCLRVDLAEQRVDDLRGGTMHFSIPPFARHCMLEGIDEIDYTLQQVGRIEAFERDHFIEPLAGEAS